MKIGIIGSGNIGGNLAKLLAAASHDVAIANSRGPQSLTGLVSSIGPHAKAATAEAAIAFGDVVILALPWRDRNQLPAAHLFDGKIVIDATNPYKPDLGLYDLGNSTSSEEMSKLMPRARLVKAFNTMYYKTLESGGRSSQQDRLALFVAGDDADAKRVVSKLIEDAGFAPVDTGSLRAGGSKQQPGSGIYNKPMTRDQALKELAKL